MNFWRDADCKQTMAEDSGGGERRHVSPRAAPSSVKVALFFLAACLALLVAGCGGVPKGDIATVGGVPITTAQFDQYLLQLAAQNGQSVIPGRGTSTHREDAAETVTALVQQQVVLNSAAGLKVSVSSQQVQSELEQLATSYGGIQKLEVAGRIRTAR